MITSEKIDTNDVQNAQLLVRYAQTIELLTIRLNDGDITEGQTEEVQEALRLMWDRMNGLIVLMGGR